MRSAIGRVLWRGFVTVLLFAPLYPTLRGIQPSLKDATPVIAGLVLTSPVWILAWRGRRLWMRIASHVGASTLLGLWIATLAVLIMGRPDGRPPAGSPMLADPVRFNSALAAAGFFVSGVAGAVILALLETAGRILSRRLGGPPAPPPGSAR